MKIHIETERLILRELNFNDIDDMFEMDSDPEVHKYLPQSLNQNKDDAKEVIIFIRKQYENNGIGRWAVVDKFTNECLGWCGLKYYREPINNHVNIYEHGYRFKQKHWGKGYATESSIAVLNWGFKNLKIDSVYAITHPENENSMHVLKKLGFEFKELFYYDFIDNEECTWFELTKENWYNKY